MPRRATPLDPEDGPEVRFALALRQLRDQAGFEARTIDAIAAKSHIPKSTLYAALRGKRIPTVPVLAALVQAWNGEPAEWLVRRTETEQEVERLRQQAMGRLQSHPGSLHDVPQPRPAKSKTPAPLGVSARTEGLQADESTEGERAGASHPSGEPTELELLLRRANEPELLSRLTDPAATDTAEIWALRRKAAWEPSMRDIARIARMRAPTVSKVLNGNDRSRRNAKRLLKAFNEIERLIHLQGHMRARGLM